MIICEERQLPPDTGRQDNHDAVETAELTEADPFAVSGAFDDGRAVGGDAHQAFGAAQDAVKAPGGLLNAGPDPFVSPAHEIGGKHGQQRLDADARGTATHQVLDFEGGFLLLIAGLDGLAAIIVVKPLRQIEIGRWWGVLVADQHRMQHAFGRMKALQPHSQGVGTAMNLVTGPTEHFRILADDGPGRFTHDPVSQRLHDGRIGRLGVDVVAQFDQLGQIRPRGKAGIQANLAARRGGLLDVFRTEALVAGLQPLALRLVGLRFRNQSLPVAFGDGRGLGQLRLGPRPLRLPPRLLLDQPIELAIGASLPVRDWLGAQRLDVDLSVLNLLAQTRDPCSQVCHARVGGRRLAQHRLDGLHTGLDALLDQFCPAARMAPQPTFRRLHQVQQARRRNRVPGMVLGTQPLPPEQRGVQANLGQLIAQPHFAVHVAEGRAWKRLAGRAHRATGQIRVQHQGCLALPQIAYGAVQKRLAHGIQHAFEHRNRLLLAGRQRATDPTGVRQVLQLPSRRDLRVLDQWCRAFAEIGQVLDAGQQAQQQLDQLLVRRTDHRLLGNRHLSQPRHQPNRPGKVAPDDDHRMLRRIRLVGCQSAGALVLGASSIAGRLTMFDSTANDEIVSPQAIRALIAQELR